MRLAQFFLLLFFAGAAPPAVAAGCEAASVYVESRGAFYYLGLDNPEIFQHPAKGLAAGRKLPGADAAQFRVLKNGTAEPALKFAELKKLLQDSNCLTDDDYGADQQRVYYHEKPIAGADPATFHIIDAGFARDAQNIYYAHEKIENVDMESFNMLVPQAQRVPGRYKKPSDKKELEGWMGGALAADDAHYYCGKYAFTKAAAVLLGKGFIKDREKICGDGLLVEGIGDVASFEITDAGFNRDKSAVYNIAPDKGLTKYVAMKLEGADPASIVYMEDVKTPGDCPFIKDKDHIYPMLGPAARQPLKNVDAASFHCVACPEDADDMVYWGQDKSGEIVYKGDSENIDIEVINAEP